jgi:hypothetical protein
MSHNPPVITRETAWHVLWHYGQPGGLQPGSFTEPLMQAMDRADRQNFAILVDAYPELGAAMTAAKYDPNGIAHLQRIGAGEVTSEEHPVPQCPEALFNPEYPGGLLHCVASSDGHDLHQTAGGIEWRVPVDSSTEVPF